MRVYRDAWVIEHGARVKRTISVFDIMEATYSGQDMGKRVITATIKWPTPIDFQIGDYVELPMQSLLRNGNHGTIYDGISPNPIERFYIYTEPQCKKTARRMSTGDAFEVTVNFYPRQYELIGVQMRDFIQQESNADNIIYTGFDTVSFYGGAHELMRRIKGCLDQQYTGDSEWNYMLADAIDEDKNNALERYSFSFSGNTVMDALMKLNDKDGINTTFFINGRTIYVGFKRPYLCCVDSANNIIDTPLSMEYGKTSHLPIDTDHGGLYDITKSVGEEVPITKLFAYGASRNLNRYYCADRIQSGRFVNKLMLPSFSDDGRTDWIISEQAAKKYGIHEGSKTFEEIYPSLRYMTYADIRGIKYCIKVRTSGLNADNWANGVMLHENSSSSYPVARVQCYKVTPCGENGVPGTYGVNTLVECAPPEDLAIFIHAYGKTVKCVLCGGATNSEAIAKQRARDARIPTTDGTTPIPGSCFAVHDNGFDGAYDKTERDGWFNAPTTATSDRESNLHRIEYVDTFWLTDLYAFTDYDQTSFKRDGYSAWAWPRFNNNSGYADSLPVNEVVAVEPVVIPDTSDNISGGRQKHWDIYLRDLGFALDEQNDFGEMVFVFNTPVVSVLDGLLAGREFTIDGGDNLNDYTERVVCAYKEDGTQNDDFFYPGDSGNMDLPTQAFFSGAMWRIRLNRNDQDEKLSNVGIVLPNTDIQMEAGNHIVLLDIYMPDIYVRAAEQRLLREAQSFLDKNDRGNVKYSINFDKVRFNQIPNYALQMREGVMLRVVDEDLNITSDNVQRMLVDHDIPLASTVQLFDFLNKTTQETKSQTYSIYDFSGIIVNYDSGDEKLTLRAAKTNEDDEFIEVSLKPSSTGQWVVPTSQYAEDKGTYFEIEMDCDENLYKTLTRDYVVEYKTTMLYTQKKSSKKFTEYKLMPAINRDLIFFKADKYYEIELNVDDDRWPGSPDKIVLSDNVGNADTYYEPQDYICELGDLTDDNTRRNVTYKFHLPSSFNEAQGYYVTLFYEQDGVTEYAEIRLKSVLEKDLDEQGSIVNYVDFKVASVNIKINDNSRPANVSSASYSADENKRGRVMQGTSEIIREITAQIDEQTKASTWSTLVNEVDNQRIEQEKNLLTFETLAQAARQNYQNLLGLRENIFDPDGTCKDTFLQVMMLQVGADSMNYQLEKTITKADGSKSNYNVSRPAGASQDKFEVFEDDVLHHFVYTQGAQNQGTWVIPGSFSANLAPVTVDNESSWPTYYVCIRCKKDSLNDLTETAWICDTIQRPVNYVDPQDQHSGEYWYFNWGILIADSSGHYTLQETRGNAYMYGDNIIAGKISDIAKNSYFDLTHGDFVLGKGGEPALEYVNGKLTIHGLTQDSIDELISEFGLSGAFNTNLWAIDEKATFALANGETKMLDCILDDEFPAGRNYTCSCIISGYTPDEAHGDESGYVYFGMKVTYTVNGGAEQVRTFDDGDSFGSVSFNEDGKLGPYVLSIDELIDIIKDEEGYASTDVIRITGMQAYVEPNLDNSDTVSFNIERGLITRGDKESLYSLAYKHLTDALQGSTEVMGGLLMTNVLLLKNKAGNVTAGMSGLSEDDSHNPENVFLFGGGTYEEAEYAAEHNYTKSATTGAGKITTLLKKDGTGKIGVFYIEEDKVVVDVPNLGKVTIDVDDGITIKDSNEDIRTIVTPKDSSLIDLPELVRTQINWGATTEKEDVTSKTFEIGSFSVRSNVNEFHLERGDGTTDVVWFSPNASHQDNRATDAPRTMTCRVYLKNGDNEIDIASGSCQSQYDYGVRRYADNFNFSLYADTTTFYNLKRGTWRVMTDVTITKVSIDTNNPVGFTVKLSPFANHYLSYYDGAPVTAVCSDGIIVAYDKNSYFKISSDSNGQSILVKGLPDSPPDTPGQLWNDNGTIKIKT